MEKPYLLISKCLLGEPCRYDGKSVPLPTGVLEKLNEKYNLISVCPEQAGGLPTPRVPAERIGARVVRKDGKDVTTEYRRGALEALALCRRYNITAALLKERSPSCGVGLIYDGSFSKTLTAGNGTTADLLIENNIKVYGESEIQKLI